MRIPGFSAHHAIGPAQTRGGTALPTRAAGVSPALGIGWGSVNSGLFWACFRNCYDRCVESEPGLCFDPCYWICNWNPNVVFAR